MLPLASQYELLPSSPAIVLYKNAQHETDFKLVRPLWLVNASYDADTVVARIKLSVHCQKVVKCCWCCCCSHLCDDSTQNYNVQARVQSGTLAQRWLHSAQQKDVTCTLSTRCAAQEAVLCRSRCFSNAYGARTGHT
eukprot:10063-Heterococcus_DN1.PRE.2